MKTPADTLHDSSHSSLFDATLSSASSSNATLSNATLSNVTLPNASPMLYLASQSPRRVELLQQLGLQFEKLSLDVDEARNSGELPEDFVGRLGLDKAMAGYRALIDQSLPLLSTSPFAVLGADTIVVCDDKILGKPTGEADAGQILRLLSGRSHSVYTSVSVIFSDTSGEYSVHSITNKTQVTFRTIEPAEVKWYWQSGEPKDKAGAYGIQGLGAIFVSQLEGSYSSVVGLPLFETSQLLSQLGFCFNATDNHV